jgi:hypothetical protein
LSIKYEYPLPQIKADINEINIKVALGGSNKGKFNVSNLSKGVLSGKITSDITGLDFYPNIWTENSCDIMYIFDSSDYHLGISLQGRAIIESDGGEVVISVTIDVLNKPIVKDSLGISNLKDFVNFAKKDFLKAKEIFSSDEFLNLCNIKDTHYINLYKRLNLEVYKEIALDNFLIATHQKSPVKVTLPRPIIDLAIKYYEDKKIKYKIPLKWAGFGTVDMNLSLKYKTDWLELQTTNLSSVNVVDGQSVDAYVIINTKAIGDKKISNSIEIAGDHFSQCVTLSIKREELFKVELSKKSYNMYDKGNLIFTNHTGEDLVIELLVLDDWVQFKSKKYFISGFAEIPFEVNLSKLFDLVQTPIYTTSVTVKTIINGKSIKKHIEVKVADHKLKKIYE